MRKLFSLFLNTLTVWALAAILTGCGGSGSEGGEDSGTNKDNGGKTEGEQSAGSAAEQALESQVKSVVNAKVIGEGLISYFDEKFKMPAADQWCDVALTETGSGKVFVSPQHPEYKQLMEKAGGGEKISHYAMNKSMAGDGFSGSKVLVFECDLGWNGSGGLDDALKYMEKNKLERIAVSKGNGSSIAVTKEELKELDW